MKDKILVIIVVFFILSCGCVFNKPLSSESRTVKINESINKAINYLYQNQLEYGEFRTYACTDSELKNCRFDSSPFTTSIVLYSIKDVDNPKVQIMVGKGTRFLLSEQEPGGVWRFWTSRNEWNISPDIDVISMSSAILTIYNQSFDDNKELVLANKNEDGLFLTWIRENGTRNDIDCVVNANALFYLRENDPVVCSYINQAIKNHTLCSIYYPNELALYYSVSRNLKHNFSCFEESRAIMIESTLAHQNTDGSFGTDLETALAVNTLLNCDYKGVEVTKGVDNLLKNQKKDGSWTKSSFFIGDLNPTLYWGSEEITTGFAIEALQHYSLIGVTDTIP